MIGAYLNGVLMANEELGNLIVRIIRFGEMFGNEEGVVKAAFADMTINGRERNYGHLIGEGGEDIIYEFGKWLS